MTRSEYILLALLAGMGFLYFFYKGTPKAPIISALTGNADAPGAGVTAKQDVVLPQDNLPNADYVTGPNFYVANQPWLGDTTMGQVMPMTSGSNNVVGAPSAQTQGIGLTAMDMARG